MMGLVAAYKRWRHSRGFGIHSPYAFRMVQEVLTTDLRYPYYAYDLLAAERRRLDCAIPLHDIFLAFRLAVEFAPRAAALSGARGSDLKILRAALRAACPGIEFVTADVLRPGDFLLSADGHCCPAVGVHALWLHAPAEYPTLAAGHIYRNPRRAVLAARQHLPAQTFEIDF